jgi:hypothetical protein
VDPHCFDADPEPDPDPAQNLDADPDPKMCIPPNKILGTPLVYSEVKKLTETETELNVKF